MIGTGSDLLTKEAVIGLPTSAPMSLCQVNDHLTICGQLLGPLVRDRDGQKRQEIKYPRKGVVNLWVCQYWQIDWGPSLRAAA